VTDFAVRVEPPDVTAQVRLERPFDLERSLGPLVRGRGDPTARIGDGWFARATRTSEGAVTVLLRRTGDGVAASVWGPGSHHVLAVLPDLVGEGDEPWRLRPSHHALRAAAARLVGLRFVRTRAVAETLVPAILEQKVNGLDARRSYRELVHAWGEPAPGPLGLRLPPAPRILAAMPYHRFHPFGVEERRARTIRTIAAHASALDRLAALPAAEARRRMMSLPGVGAWTAAEVARTAFGDADAVSVGDFHIPHLVTWTLAREPRGTDARMLELLEPYRGQRGRAVRMLELAYGGAPRFGPRMAIHSIRDL
jgi:3-methyladenine DNA glycosylase/8-oxoguanine DNA glycosylase